MTEGWLPCDETIAILTDCLACRLIHEGFWNGRHPHQSLPTDADIFVSSLPES